MKNCPNCVDTNIIRKQFIERDLFNATDISQIKWRIYGQNFTKQHFEKFLKENRKAIEKLEIGRIEKLLPESMKEGLKQTLLTIHTITSDNGKEFSKHKELSEEFNLDYYFAHPYHSWERGSNENYNRLLRQYFPKGADLRFISQEELERVQNKLNNRPRKRFGYMSPKEVYLQAIKNQGNVNLLNNNQQSE